jgi:hypothetical protein
MARAKRPPVEERQKTPAKEQENGDLRTRPIEIDAMRLEFDDIVFLESLGRGRADVGGFEALRHLLAKVIVNWSGEEVGKMPLPRVREASDALRALIEEGQEATGPKADSGS